jgi:adenine deaminase
MAVGLIAGLGINGGAVAATINAGAFNLMVAGRDDAAMALAAGRVAELHGGIVVANGERGVAELALPLFGILTDEPLADALADARGVQDAIREVLRCDVEQLVPCLGFACLVGFPELRVSAGGLVRHGAGGPEIVGVAVEAPAPAA